jgi:hypothetical protein
MVEEANPEVVTGKLDKHVCIIRGCEMESGSCVMFGYGSLTIKHLKIRTYFQSLVFWLIIQYNNRKYNNLPSIHVGLSNKMH